jgi:hypothetical protein
VQKKMVKKYAFVSFFVCKSLGLGIVYQLGPCVDLQCFGRFFGHKAKYFPVQSGNSFTAFLVSEGAFCSFLLPWLQTFFSSPNVSSLEIISLTYQP